MHMSLIRTATRLLALVALAGLLSACGSSKQTADEDPPRNVPDSYVEISNRSRYIMTMYVFRRDGSRVRLGEVSAYRTETFALPKRIVPYPVSLRFLADPLAGNVNPISEQLPVDPGDTVRLTIPPF